MESPIIGLMKLNDECRCVIQSAFTATEWETLRASTEFVRAVNEIDSLKQAVSIISIGARIVDDRDDVRSLRTNNRPTLDR
jgi:hypothetical protein